MEIKHQAVRFTNKIWGVQFHPEFDKNVMNEYIENKFLYSYFLHTINDNQSLYNSRKLCLILLLIWSNLDLVLNLLAYQDKKQHHLYL